MSKKAVEHLSFIGMAASTVAMVLFIDREQWSLAVVSQIAFLFNSFKFVRG